MVLEAVMFDLDGTLIEFQIDYPQIKLRVIEILKETGYPVEKMHKERYVLRLVADVLVYLQNILKWNQRDIESLHQKVNAVISEGERSAALKAQLIPGMQQVVEFLSLRKIKIGVITLNTTQNAYVSLKVAGLLSYIPNSQWIVGRDQTDHTKPHPAHPTVLLERFKTNSQNTWLIGDHPTDIEAANSVGCKSIAIIGSKYDKNSFQTPHIVHRHEIHPKIINIFSKVK